MAWDPSSSVVRARPTAARRFRAPARGVDRQRRGGSRSRSTPLRNRRTLRSRRSPSCALQTLFHRTTSSDPLRRSLKTPRLFLLRVNSHQRLTPPTSVSPSFGTGCLKTDLNPWILGDQSNSPLEYVKLARTKGARLLRAVETKKRTYLAVLCGDEGERIELFTVRPLLP